LKKNNVEGGNLLVLGIVLELRSPHNLRLLGSRDLTDRRSRRSV